jgi:hypothetical protein
MFFVRLKQRQTDSPISLMKPTDGKFRNVMARTERRDTSVPTNYVKHFSCCLYVKKDKHDDGLNN